MRGIPKEVLRLSVIALVAGVVACGGAKAPMAVKPEQTGAKPLPSEDPRTQIDQLEADIAAARDTLGLAEPSESELPGTQAVPLSKPPYLQDGTCKPAKNDTCTKSCTLSDSICGNADKICKLAVEINDDPARGKCVKANKTCELSRKKCCGCQ